MKKIVITLTAVAGMLMSGCAYDYYGHYAYGDGSPNTLGVVTTQTITYSTPDVTQMSAGVVAATQMSARDDAGRAAAAIAGKTALETAGDGQTP
jgi:hypothetical protein